jgi:predicted RNase H-like HicB family nuclease
MESYKFSFTAVYAEDPKGGYSAYIEEIQGVNTQGETLEEAKENLMEALKMVLETNKILSQKNAIKNAKSIRETLQFSE